MALSTLIAAYAALGSAVATNGVITELSGNGYARQAVTLQYDPVAGVIYFNGVAFGPATGTDSSAVAVAFFDASSGGNQLLSFPIPTEAWTSGLTLTVPTGTIQLTGSAIALFNSVGTVPPNTVLGTVTDQLGAGLTGVTATSGPVILKVSTSYVLSASSVVNTITYAATITPNAALADTFKVTLTGNLTMNAPINPVPGHTYRFELIQDGTGSRLLTLGTGFKTAGGAPTLSTAANAIDWYTAYYDGTTFWGVLNKAFA